MKQSLAYRICRDEDPHRSSVLWGTMHLGMRSDILVSQLKILMEPYRCIYTETDLGAQLTTWMWQCSKLPEGLQWRDYLGDKRYNKIRSIILKSYEIDIKQIQTLRPLLVMNQLYQKVYSWNLSPSMDQWIWNEAAADNKSTRGLESVDEQAEVLAKIPIEYDFSMLKKLCRNISKSRREIKTLINLYERQKVHTLYKRSKASLGPVRKILLYDRNMIMARRIVAAHDDEQSFFSFGAGHLSGQFGIISLLKKSGFSVRPLELSL